MKVPLWNAIESAASAIDELRKQTRDLAEEVAKDVVRLERKVEALTVEVEQFKPEPKQEERFIEFKRVFPPTALTIKADGKTLDALIEKERISLFDVDRILRDQVPAEGVVHGDTDFQVRWKEDSGIIEPDPSSFTGKRAGLAPSYDWEVRDCVGRQWREGTTDSLDEAEWVGRAAMAAAPPSLHPCKLQVCVRRVLLEISSDD